MYIIFVRDKMSVKIDIFYDEGTVSFLYESNNFVIIFRKYRMDDFNMERHPKVKLR